MPIRQQLLDAPENRFVEAEAHEPLRAVLQRIAANRGDDYWHVVFQTRRGDWLAVLAQLLLENVARGRMLLDLPIEDAATDLRPTWVVDRDDMGSDEAQRLAQAQPDKVLVVTTNRGQKLLGIVTGGIVKRSGTLLIRQLNLTQAYEPLLEETALETASDNGEAEVKSQEDGDDKAAPRAFEAYPDLQAPERVEPQTEFAVSVGFRAEADETLAESRKVKVEDVTEKTELWVMLVTDGAEVLGSARQPLALDMNASVTFKCKPKPGETWITLTAHYWHNARMAGMARRVVPVAAANVYPLPSVPAQRPNPCRVSMSAPGVGTDLQVTVQIARNGQLHWTFVAPNPVTQIGPLATELADAREFAGSIITDLRTQGFAGVFAARILENIGQDIADIMPHEFFDVLEAVHKAVSRPPTVLLYTNEPYVPWELALLPRKLDPALPGFLGTQAVVGRWLLDDSVIFPPPTSLDVKLITAVAAEYDINSGLRELQFAFEEQKKLVALHQAHEVRAQRDLLERLVEPPQDGHLIHFAVHGVSDPRANEEAILLGDGSRLVARALTGSYECGGTPPFAFVFLNACQVGTAGSAFGQAAGFPGDLVRGGVAGFVAPLWEVDDQTAANLAESFYDATFNKNQPVAAALRDQRLAYTRQGHTTPMAYIFYGHPDLRLKKGQTP